MSVQQVSIVVSTTVLILSGDTSADVLRVTRGPEITSVQVRKHCISIRMELEE